MARIPIIKLNNGNTSYYPLSVGESTVTTHNIEVKNDIGGYQKGDTIPAVTTFDEILTNLFETEGSGSEVVIDNITIVRNLNDELCVDLDEIFSNKNCDEVTATKGLIINSISQTDGKISVSVRALEGDDIPTITTTQVNGLETRLTDLEAPLTKDKIPNIDIIQVNNLSTKLSETIDVSRIPTIPISRVDGLSEALEVPIVQDWGPWTKQGESGECYRVFWDNSQWKYKNDDGNLVTFDSGLPSTTSPDAYQLVIGELVFCRHKQQCSVVTVPGLKRALTAEDSTGYNSISSNKSIIGRIKQLEDGGGTGTVKSVNGVEPDTAGNVTLSKLIGDTSSDKIWKVDSDTSFKFKKFLAAKKSLCRKLVYGNSTFVMLGQFNYTDTTSYIYYSEDFVNWTKVADLSTQDNRLDAIYALNKFVISGFGTGGLWYSSNGVTWTQTSITTGEYCLVTDGTAIYAISGVGGKTYKSTNGTTWTQISTSSSDPTIRLIKCIYANEKFVACAPLMDGSMCLHHCCYYSEDGYTWTKCAMESFDDIAIAGVCYGNGRFMAVSANKSIDYVFTSVDGVNWTITHTSGESEFRGYKHCIYGNGRFLTLSATGIRYSTDNGVTWTRTNYLGSKDTSGSIIYDTDRFYLVNYWGCHQGKDNWITEIVSQDNASTYVNGDLTSATNEVHEIISTEVSNKLDEMKFSVADTAEIFTLQDVVRILKNVLIKLGMQEEAITINTSAFES